MNRSVGAMIRGGYAHGWLPLKLEFIRRTFGIVRAAQVAGQVPTDYMPKALRLLGASIGQRCLIKSPLVFDNAEESLENLTIGDHCHIGTDSFFDLVESIVMEEDVTIAARVNILTHFSVGERPLADVFPRRAGGVVIKTGANIGMGATIFHGISIGRCAVVGAGAVVTKDVPDHTVAVGVPARPIRDIG